MKKIGIIAEFNPFHNGHIYLINNIKKMFPDSLICVITSTNFTQRGEFSYLTKWDKTILALNHQVDLVIELPFFYQTQSSDIFASYAVSVLEYLEMDYLVFGSECNDIEILKNIASTTIYNNEFDNLVREYLNLGNSYPASVSKAIYNLTNFKLINSNDILGVSYIKTIMLNNYNIKPLCIKRTNRYLNQKTTSSISSATSIRCSYLKNKNISKYVPKDTLNFLTINQNYLDNYFNILKYKLISEIDNLEVYMDVIEGIDKKIKKNILEIDNLEDLLNKLKNKRFTYNKLNRMFLHILFNIKKGDKYGINYIRVLGFNSNGRSYLKYLKSEITIPIITNYKEIDDELLHLEKIATIIYLNIINRPDLIKEELKSIPINKE